MKKKLIMLSVCFLLVGCTPNAVEESYSKMQNITNGYSLDLRIYGTVDNENVNEIVKITNSGNNEYKIVIKNIKRDIKEEIISAIDMNRSINRDILIDEDVQTIYIKKGKVYTIDENGKYKETKKNLDYNNLGVYIEALDEVKSITNESNKIIGDSSYNVYSVVFNKNIINEMLKDTSIDLEVKDNVFGTVYINDDGYVYRILYKINDLTINANYFGINSVSKIRFPKEI